MYKERERLYNSLNAQELIKFAAVAELADALDSKSSDGNIVRVRPPLAA